MPVAVQDVLPVELIEYILSLCDPLEVAAFAQTSSFFRKIVYETPDQHLWRSLYLSQPFDDPRNAVSPLGTPKSSVDWRTELQRIIRARTIIEFKDVIMCHEEERCTVLETLLNMIDNVSPAPHLFSDQLSRNLLWVAAMLRGAGTFLHHDKWTPTSRELQLRARLHTHFGLTPIDTKPARRVESRCLVYDMRRYNSENSYGPFLQDGSGRVDWTHMRAIHHCISMHVVDIPETEDFAFTVFPMSLPFGQPVIAPDTDLDQEDDWAGVEGIWSCTYCFCDHRELLSEL